MLINIFFLLAASGLLAIILKKNHYDSLLSFLMCAFSAFLMINMLENWQLGLASTNVFPWIQYQKFNININLSTNNSNYLVFLPLMLIAVLSMLNNVLSKNEMYKLRLNGLIAMNLAAFILLVNSADFVQLIVSSSIITVLGLYMIDDFAAKKKYIYYNLLADMGLFTVFAIIYGSTHSVELASLSRYKDIGTHKDLVAILVLISLFAKSGLFLFQNQLLDLSGLNFNRLLVVCFCSTPVASFIILSKINALLLVSAYVAPILYVVIIASALWGFFGAMLIDNIKEKALYLSMLFYAYIFYLLAIEKEMSFEMVGLNLLGAYLLNIPLLWINVAASNEIFVSRMGRFLRNLKFTFFMSLLIIWSFSGILLSAWQPDKIIAWIYLGMILISFSHLFYQVFRGSSAVDERVEALLCNPGIFSWLPPILLASLLVYISDSWQNAYSLYAIIVVLVLTFVGPLRFLARLSDVEVIQNNDILEKIYNAFFLEPIRILGRVLWLTIDFLLIERTLISSLHHFVNLFIRILQKIQKPYWYSYLLMSLSGLGIVIYYLIRVKL